MIEPTANEKELYLRLINLLKERGVDRLPMHEVWELMPEDDICMAIHYGDRENLFLCLPEDYLVLSSMREPV